VDGKLTIYINLKKCSTHSVILVSSDKLGDRQLIGPYENRLKAGEEILRVAQKLTCSNKDDTGVDLAYAALVRGWVKVGRCIMILSSDKPPKDTFGQRKKRYDGKVF